MMPRMEDSMTGDVISQGGDDIPGANAPHYRRSKAPLGRDFSRVRSNMKDFGRGVMKFAPKYRQHDPRKVDSQQFRLPPRDFADRLIQHYYDCVHSFSPILYWPSFYEQYAHVYQYGITSDTSKQWLALYFNVLACGSLFMLGPDRFANAEVYMHQGKNLLDLFEDDFTMDHARVAFLSSICLFELNMRSASWAWLGTAIRIAQDIGLHIQSTDQSPVEEEMKKRVWYTLYIWDRYVRFDYTQLDRTNSSQIPCP